MRDEELSLDADEFTSGNFLIIYRNPVRETRERNGILIDWGLF
jgi:hypothetical protein